MDKKCPVCNNIMILLLNSYACDYCDKQQNNKLISVDNTNYITVAATLPKLKVPILNVGSEQYSIPGFRWQANLYQEDIDIYIAVTSYFNVKFYILDEGFDMMGHRVPSLYALYIEEGKKISVEKWHEVYVKLCDQKRFMVK